MDWDELLYSLPGVYPATVSGIPRRLLLIDRIPFTTDRSLNLCKFFCVEIMGPRKLPTPHPQDSLWWFGDVALERVLGDISNSVTHSDGVLLLGTPSLFHYLKAHSLRCSVLLLDKTVDHRRRSISRLPFDVFTDGATDERFDVIVPILLGTRWKHARSLWLRCGDPNKEQDSC